MVVEWVFKFFLEIVWGNWCFGNFVFEKVVVCEYVMVVVDVSVMFGLCDIYEVWMILIEFV